MPAPTPEEFRQAAEKALEELRRGQPRVREHEDRGRREVLERIAPYAPQHVQPPKKESTQ